MNQHHKLAALALFVLASPLLAAEFAPHPACLDLDLRQPARDGFLPAPLPLTACALPSAAVQPYDHLGFSSYDRPRDAAGTLTGSVGYQRIGGASSEVLYVLQVHGGGSGVYTELLVGHERQDASAVTLVDGRLHGLSSECGGLVDAWAEPNGRIRMILNLSPAGVLQALVAPRAQPPRAERDTRTLQALFSQDTLHSNALSDRSCPGFAEYELHPERLEWQLDSLRLDIIEDADEAALAALVERVPALAADGVAMLLGEELKAVRAALLGALPRAQMPPRDDTALDADYSAFRDRLGIAVHKRDAEALIGMTEPHVMLGFGDSGGHDTLRQWLRHPDTAINYWSDLEYMLQLGSVRTGQNAFCLPYPSCISIEPAPSDPYRVLIVAAPETPLLEQPKRDARKLRILDHDVLQRNELFGEQDAGFQRVQLHDGEVGYIDSTALRSPLDLRMEIVRSQNGWRIRSIVAGD